MPAAAPAAVCFLFTDIEGSTRLWEQQTDLMRAALARHDALNRSAVQAHGGRIVKGTGDGIHAVFEQPLQALLAMLQLQHALADAAATAGLALSIRCGLHCAAAEARDNDFYGPEVNRAARIMGVAHGGQMLVSGVVADALQLQLPAGVQLKDLGAVRLRDLSRPERLWQVLAPPLRVDFPALRSLAATPNNLAQPLNRFVGRAPVLAQLRELLLQHRLVTLFGTGGIGKSRLSAQLGAELIEHYPDGVWFIELAPLQDTQQAAERVAQAMASVLGVKEEPGRSVADALQQFVADRQLLLILDNCEHVLGAAATLAKTLLQAGPRTTVLATSREVLRVAGELAYPVPALTVPDAVPGTATDATTGATPGGTTTAALPRHLISHEAVQLFTDRARSAQPGFRLDAHNAAAVVDICRRLDGIPLALELAAARVRALPVQAIASRLRDSFALLTTRDETVAPRQRTLQLLIDWSHDLLDEPERVLYRRLSVFAGGWTLEAAEVVCGGDEVLRSDAVLDLLTGLVEKSLVALVVDGVDGVDGGGAAPRYRLLETVRQHAAERLQVAEADAAALRQRHLAVCLALAEQALPQLGGANKASALAQLDHERENLLAALAWCAADGALHARRSVAEQGLRLGFALRPYWLNRGLLTLGLDTTLRVLAHPAAAAHDAVRARALFNVGQLCCFMGRNAEAMGYLVDCLDIARAVGDKSRVAAVLQPMGMAAIGLGDRVAARQYMDAALQAARDIDNQRQVASAYNGLAQLDRMEGRLDEAERNYRASLDLVRYLQDQDYIATALLNLAMVALTRGADGSSDAQKLLLEVLPIAQKIGSRPAEMCAFDVAAALAVAHGDWLRAAHYFGLTEAQNTVSGLRRDAADEAFLVPVIQRVREMLGPTYASATYAGRTASFEVMWTDLTFWLGEHGPFRAQ